MIKSDTHQVIAIIYHIYFKPIIIINSESGLLIFETENMVSKNSKSGASTTTLLTDSSADYKKYIRSVLLPRRS